MSSYTGKRILLVAPKFYHYHQEIINTLEDGGALVTFYPEMEYSLLYRIAQKLNKKLAIIFEKKYIDSMLEKISKNTFDIVFTIRGGYFSSESLETLHLKLPEAKFYMYQWDSVKQNNYLPIMKYFDRVQTFDMVDAKEYGIAYLPLFYTNEYKKLQNKKEDPQYDIVFFGAYHSDRLEIIKKIDTISKDKELVFKYHLFITKLALFKLIMTKKISLLDIKYFKTFSLPLHTIIETYKVSKAVLDVELEIQNGFTIRTIEALGANLKLLTTNKNIKKSDFYNAETMMWIDRDSIKINQRFFDKTYPPSLALEKFYIDRWLENILVDS
jgi:hypothetical protein